MAKKRKLLLKKRCVFSYYKKKGEHDNVFLNRTYNLKNINKYVSKLFRYYYYEQCNVKFYCLQIAARIAYIEYIKK
jgi:hypothetical protein